MNPYRAPSPRDEYPPELENPYLKFLPAIRAHWDRKFAGSVFLTQTMIDIQRERILAYEF